MIYKFEKLESLLGLLKINIRFVTPKDQYDCFYNPIKKGFAEINFKIKPREIFNSNLKSNLIFFVAHELGHFILSSKSERRKKDYGIMGFSFKNNLNEVKAVMIQNSLLRSFGIIKSKDPFYGIDIRIFIDENKKEILNWWKAKGKKLTQNYIEMV